MSGYDVAQVCREGHMVTTMAARFPQHREDYCAQCGSPTLMACETCSTPIRGFYHVDGVLGITDNTPRPAFCTKCGAPYPWTQSAVDAAKMLADELEKLKPEEREALKGSLADLVRDTSRTPVAVLKFKKLVARAGAEGASALRDVLIGVVTEAARKGIWGP